MTVTLDAIASAMTIGNGQKNTARNGTRRTSGGS